MRSMWIPATLALAGCACGAPPPAVDGVKIPTLLASPAPPGSSTPNLTSDGRRVALSWIEAADDGPARLRFAIHDGQHWSRARTVVQDEQLFVNWADFPSLALVDDRTLAAHWLERIPGGAPFAYGIRFSVSADGGSTWSPPARPHPPGPHAEHGFVSLVPRGGARIALVWLDGRELTADGGAMQLRHREWDGERLGPESVLDDDVCTCCQTTALDVGDALFVAYRDHTAGEIRDISTLRFVDAELPPARSLSADGWQIGGCPVNGPAAAHGGRHVGVTWFTEADGEPRVLLSRSADGGTTFGAPRRVDDGQPLGRVALALQGDDTAWVAWLESAEEQALVRVRGVQVDGTERAAWTVGRTSSDRRSGFPRLALADGRLFVAWTEVGPPSQVVVAAVDL